LTRRRVVRVAVATLALLWLLAPEAAGHDLGSDLLGNIAPSSPGSAPGSLFLRHPIGAYALDYDSNVGISHLESIPPTIAQFIASLLWTATAFVVHTVIQLFTWAFSLDLVNGDRGSAGALNPVSSAIGNLWSHLFGQGWLLAALAIAGLWGTYNAFVRRRYSETAGALASTAAIIFIALFFVLEPQQTIGQASRWTNQASLAMLSATTRGTVINAQQAKGQAADQLFKTLVYDPWVVLEFGGLTHCVDPRHTVSDGYPRPVSPTAPGPKICHDHEKQGVDGHGGYAERFLAFAPGSDQRKAEYAAVRDGKTPDNKGGFASTAPMGSTGSPPPPPSQFARYRVDKTDSPAVDSQQLGSAYPRVVMAAVVLVGSLGAVVLIGFLALAVILAQVLALVLLAFAPVALVIGAIPGRGHAFFWSWLQKLATALFVKLIYSLLIAVVLTVAAALVKATGQLGFLFAFLLETIFFWAIFVYRHKLTDRLVLATTGEQRERSGVRRFAGAAVGAAVAARGAQAMRSRASATRPVARGQLAGGANAMAPVPSLRERAEHSLAEDHVDQNAERQLRRRQQYLMLKPIKSSDEQAELERLRSGAPAGEQRGARQRREIAQSVRGAAGLPAHPPRGIRGRERQIAEGLRHNGNGNGNGPGRVRPSVNPRPGGTEAPAGDHPRGTSDAGGGGLAQVERTQRTPRQAHEAIKRTIEEQRRTSPVPAPDRQPPHDEGPSGRRP